MIIFSGVFLQIWTLLIIEVRVTEVSKSSAEGNLPYPGSSSGQDEERLALTHHKHKSIRPWITL